MNHEELSAMANRVRAFVGTPDHHSLYPHQQTMLLALADRLESDEPSGSIVSATGTGKTYTSGALAVACAEPTVIVTPRNIIGDQTYKTFIDPQKFSIDVAQHVGVYDGQQLEWKKWVALKRRILITTYPSFINLVESGQISADPHSPNYRKTIILDEAHRATGEKFLEAVKPFTQSCYVTTWTATDEFSDGTNVSDRVFGPGKKYIYKLNLPNAVKQGFLVSAIHCIPIEVDLDMGDLKQVYDEYKDYSKKTLKKFVLNRDLQDRAVKMYMDHEDPETHIRFRGLPCLVNTYGIEAAEQTAKKFNEVAGKTIAVSISGNTPRNQVRNKEGTGILDRFDKGEIKVLCAADLLIEGFDSKDVSIVMSLRPSLSPWLVEQMLGRGARKQSAGYFDRYGHDKQLFAVNFFDKTMKPLLFSDVIKGNKVNMGGFAPRLGSLQFYADEFCRYVNSEGPLVEFEKKQVYAAIDTDLNTNFAEQPPQSSWDLVRAIEKESRYKGDPNKQQNDYERFEKFLKTIKAKLPDGNPLKTYDRRKASPIHDTLAKDMPEVRSSATTQPSVRLYSDLNLSEKTDEWLSLKDIDALPGHAIHSSAGRAVRKIINAFDPNKRREVQQIPYKGQVIRVQQLQSGAHTPICLHREDLPLVEKAENAVVQKISPKKPGDSARGDRAR